ncbi:hypothetical protein ACIOC1_04150 [Streptomyces sp. NPDC088197]|uniref:hypothetical protein n=1 Tax=Streptomyces sp. NPDC088197 TaxID=3365840 RepID=UPI00381DD34F
MADDGETPTDEAEAAPPEGVPQEPLAAGGSPEAHAVSDSAEKEGDAQGFAELHRAFGQQVHNHFHSTVEASGATFGFGAPRAPGLAPGNVRPEEVDHALRHYLRPQPCFSEALAKLRRDHLVVLSGHEDTGRRAGAFALLRELTEPGIGLRSLSPANSLAGLTAPNALKERQAFVILDYVGETNADPVQSYDIGRLAEELRRKDSYLVITATESSLRRLAFDGYRVPWRAPDPKELFRACLDPLPAAGLPSALMERVGEQRRPADVVAAATGFSAGGTPTAMKTMSGSDADAVRTWFRKVPLLEDLLPLAALAFLEGIPERSFEEHLATLEGLVRDWELSGESAPGERDAVPAPGTGTTVLRQSRALWRKRATGLVRVDRRPEPGLGADRSERRMVFISPGIRELVIGELHTLYGYELWYPLRRWLHDLAQHPDLAVRTEVARGTALFAGHSLAEVDDLLLQEWADGLTNQRVTAALTLQHMAETDRLAPAALSIALGWASNRGQARAITMAMALSGTLGSVYRLEVLNWLWRLTGRGERMAAAARRSVVLLLQTAEQEPERALFTLRYIRTRMANARAGTWDHRRTTLIAAQVLVAPRLGNQPGTLPGALLRQRRENARQLGKLWAGLLLSRSRRTAFEALCDTLVDVRDEPSVADAVRTLGEAMREEMTPAQWQALSSRLLAVLRHPDLAMPSTRQMAHVLLGTLGV